MQFMLTLVTPNKQLDIEKSRMFKFLTPIKKTLSLRLDSNTVHFFFNEHRADFPLFTEGEFLPCLFSGSVLCSETLIKLR